MRSSSPGRRRSNRTFKDMLLERGLTSGGPFTLIQSNLLKEMTYYRDTGLNGLTRYFYRVAAVDRSGNWSPYSTPVGATTNAAVLAGWPFTVTADPNSGAPTVENLNASGPYEIFFTGRSRLRTAERRHRDHRRGQDLLDPRRLVRARQLTTGPSRRSPTSTTTARSRWSPPRATRAASTQAAARSSSGTAMARCSGRRPSERATSCWPRPFCPTSRATRKLEVIAQNRGALYAWNSDGTPVITGQYRWEARLSRRRQPDAIRRPGRTPTARPPSRISMPRGRMRSSWPSRRTTPTSRSA